MSSQFEYTRETPVLPTSCYQPLSVSRVMTSLTYYVLLLAVAPVPLYIWLSSLWSYTAALVSYMLLPSPATSYEVNCNPRNQINVLSMFMSVTKAKF